MDGKNEVSMAEMKKSIQEYIEQAKKLRELEKAAEGARKEAEGVHQYDSTYSTKTRHKEEAEIEVAKQQEAMEDSKNKISETISQQLIQKDWELKDLEQKYLNNAKKSLEKAEEQIRSASAIDLIDTQDIVKKLEAEKEVATNAITVLKQKSDKLCVDIETLRFYGKTLRNVTNQSVDLEKLSKIYEEMKSTDPIRKVMKQMEELEAEQRGAGKPEGEKPEGEKPEGGKPEGEKPEMAKIIAIKYIAHENRYELTYDDGKTGEIRVDDPKAVRDFKKSEKRYLKEKIKTINPMRYKRADIALLKALMDMDKTNLTEYTEEYMKILNGQEGDFVLSYDASKMNHPQAFNNQDAEVRRIMTRTINYARGNEVIGVKGFKPSPFQRFTALFTGVKRLEAPKEEERASTEGNFEPTPIGNTEGEFEPTPEESRRAKFEKTPIEEFEMTDEQAKKLEEAVGRRTGKGKKFADEMHRLAQTEEREDPVEGEKEPTVDEIIEEVKKGSMDEKDR